MTASTTGTNQVHFDPYDHEIVADPYPVFARLRNEAPLYRNDTHDFFALSRYDDVSAVLQDHTTYSSAKGDILELIQADIEYPPGVLIFEDPPIHPIHRRILSRIFTPKRIAALEPEIRDFCVRALDPLVGSGGFDVIADLGAQVPMRAIGMLLGIPESEQEAVRDAVDESLRTEPGKPMSQDQLLVDGEAFTQYVDWRADHLSDDIISQLLQAEIEDETGTVRRLARQEIVTYVTVLAGAGNETTGRLIGWATKLLAEHPEQRRELVADHSLIPGAIEEILRLEPPGPFFCRYVTRDVEWYGTTVPRGSVLMAILAAANRDERRYENPDTFDIRRKVAHLSFGGGIHFCLGNALARLEGRVVLEEMLKRFPTWDVDLSAARMSPTSTVRGWETLPIRLP
ncbi:cytochrome P450 [Cryptosporangium minutisporangium]|uniref:Cytochrome P450 n=1 Tax=Cryptosporangium minutisporangium TaxID=113569 RepID=A0ABP6SSB3_9ACTN